MTDDDAQERPRRHRSPRANNIQVVVRMSGEPIDFDAWAQRYVRLVIELTRCDGVLPPAPPLERED